MTAFTEFWAANPDVKRIWFSLYTPQMGEDSPSAFAGGSRAARRRDCALYEDEPKLHDMIPSVVRGYLHPPQNPDDCIFARRRRAFPPI